MDTPQHKVLVAVILILHDTLVSGTSNGILSISINSRMKSGNKVSENTVLVV